MVTKSKISFQSFHASVARTARSYTDTQKTLTVSALGVVGEAGEYADLVKKHIGHDHPLDREKALKELGDVLYYLDWAASALDSSLEEVACMNRKKLRERYPEGFTVAKSFHRGQ